MSGVQRQLAGNAQRSLNFGEQVVVAKVVAPDAVGDESFVCGDEGDFYIGEQRLDQYLRHRDQVWVVRLKALLAELNYEQLTSCYQALGRRAIHPRVILGLIVYGIINGQWTLRGLERLARVDLGAMWLAGRLQPDHSTIGKFISLHREVLSEDFFDELLKFLVTRLHLAVGTVAVDGTVIEAAASHYSVLRAEALREADRTPEVEQALAERQRDRELHGRDTAMTAIAPGEPQAVVQQTKQGLYRPSYKPSLMVHSSGIIAAKGVPASKETAVVMPMVDCHVESFGAPPARLLADAGYSELELLGQLAERNIDVLCPAGQAHSPSSWVKQSRQGKIPKSAFRYDPDRDLYHCPAGRELERTNNARDAAGRNYTVYRGRRCGDCPLKLSCTKSAAGRTLNRYVGDELKEAMAQVFTQAAARQQYRKRAAIVEPVFALLRQRQRLIRFHRRGLAGANIEFSLHCIAFNLRKAVGLAETSLFCVLLVRLPHRKWTLGAIASASP